MVVKNTKMTNSEVPPCINCICIPICKERELIDLKNGCELVEYYLFTGMVFDRRRPDFDDRIYKVCEVLHPNKWFKIKGGDFTWRRSAKSRV